MVIKYHWREKELNYKRKLQRYNYLNLGISRLVFAAKIVWIQKENLIAVHYYYLFFYKLDFPESAKK